MNKNLNMIYGVKDLPKKWYEWILYPIQMLLSVFVATILISTICGTPIDVGLLGGCLGTLVYQIITRFKSPIFISNSGAMVSAICGALIIGSGVQLLEYMSLPYEAKLLVDQNYFAVFIGGLVVLLIYGIFALVIKLCGIKVINKLFPAIIVGPVTMVIGLNLAGFIPTYVYPSDIVLAVSPDYALMATTLIAVATMIVIALTSHYFKGFLKTIPFLIGLVFGYAVSSIVTVCGLPIIDFSKFHNITSLFSLPDFSFLHWGDGIASFDWLTFGNIVLLFAPVSICALLEHYSDHKVMSAIIGTDLTEDPGLHRTLLADGVASAIGTAVCGLPNTSYGESTATIGFSKVATVWMTTIAAGLLGLLAFIQPVQIFIQSIPSCVFGGCAMILYGYIACSGLKTIINNKIDLENNKNLVIVSVILTVGVSGIFLFTQSFAGVSLAMVLGVILNVILVEKNL